MKDIEQLAVTSTSVDVLTPKVIAKTIEEIARSERVYAQLFRENRDLMNQPGRAISFPKKGSGISCTVGPSEGTSISTSDIAYSAVTVTVQKYGVGLKFTNEALESGMRDIIADSIKEAGEVYADTIDQIALQTFCTIATFSGTAATTTATTLCVLGVKSQVSTATAQFVIGTSAATGGSMILSAADTLVCYIPITGLAGTVISSASAAATATINARDLLLTRAKVVSQNFDPDVCVMHPDRLADILYDPSTKFLEAQAYGGREPLLNAELGRVFGMKVLVPNRSPKYGILLVDSKSYGYQVFKRNMDMKKDEVSGLKEDALYFYGFSEQNFGVVNTLAAAWAVVNAGTHTYA